MVDLKSPKTLAVAGAVLLVVALGVFAYWGATGSHFVTQYEVLETVTVETDFGEEEREEWVDEFQFGLMPDLDENPVMGAAVLGGVPGGLGLLLLIAAGVMVLRDSGSTP